MKVIIMNSARINTKSSSKMDISTKNLTILQLPDAHQPCARLEDAVSR